MSTTENTELIDPATLPANFDLDTLIKNPQELAKYAFPKDFTPIESQYYSDQYYNQELVLSAVTPEDIGKAVLEIIGKFNRVPHRKDKARRITRIYLDFRASPPMSDESKLKAIKGVLDAKKRAAKAAATKKAETLKKAAAAARTLQSLGVTVELPDALKTPEEKAAKKPKK